MSIIRDFTLYLHAGISVPPVVHVNQYDQGEVWRFTLLEEDGSQYTPSSGALIGVKADGHAIAGVTGTVMGDGRVSITETQQMTAAAGKAVFELTIDGGAHGTANFIVQVEPKPTDSAILSDSDLSIIQEGLNSVTPVVIEEKVSDWLEENFTEPPVDPTLSISNAAADAKVTGDEITDLKTAINLMASDELVDYSKGVLTSWYISPSSNKWTNNAGYACCLYKIPPKTVNVTVVANETFNGIIGLLKTTTHSSLSTPDYATGETGLRSTPVGTTHTYNVPSDCGYVYVYLYNANGDNDRRPTSLTLHYLIKPSALDETLTISGDAADSKAVGDRINGLERLSDVPMPFTITDTGNGIQYETGEVYSASAFSVTNYVNVDGYKSITYRRIIAAIANRPQHGMAFYDSELNYISGYRSANDAEATQAYEDCTLAVPSDAVYARFTTRTDTETYGDFYVYGKNILKSSIDSLISERMTDSHSNVWMAGLLGLTLKTNGKFNVVARMRMMCDTEWTPLAPVPKQRNINGTIAYSSFSAGEKLKGMPYGAQLTYEQWLGKNISFETFLSALKNPNSVIYDFSRVGTAYRQSAWYSVNCSKAVAWALNIANTYASGAFATDPHITKIANFGSYTANDIQIGDIIEKTGTHTAIVTDLVYNTFGELSQIEVSEAVTPTCRRKRWNLYGTFENFWTVFDGYALLRYDYVDSVPPVNMEAMYPYISTSLGLNYGNKSNYKLGDSVEVTLLNKVSDTLNVLKNGVQISAIDVSAFDQSAIVTYTPQSTGWYEVIFDGDSENNGVGFCVVEETATLDTTTNVLTFSSSECALFMVSYLRTSSRQHHSDVFPTAEDLANGYMQLTIPSSTDYIHLTFANDYGKTIIEIAI